MRAPILMLAWELWRQKFKYAGLCVGTIPCFLLFHAAIHGHVPDPGIRAGLGSLWMYFSLFWVLAIFNYTESNPGKAWTGFPYRLFVLPVPTVVLVSVPMLLGMASVALVYVVWVRLIFAPLGLAASFPLWLAGVFAVDVACFQAIVWSLAGFRIARTIVLSLASLVALVFEGGTWVFIQSGSITRLDNYLFWERLLAGVYVVLALTFFLWAWFSLARQRRGGGRGRGWFKAAAQALIERIIDALPGDKKAFASPEAAQFWLEWRQGGMVLPASVGCVLLLILGPVSWLNQNGMNTVIALWIVELILLLPMVLGFVIGKGFAKPDFWSTDLALKPFLAVRPLSAGEMVAAKMKVAALSTLIAWLLVLAAIPLWVALWVEPGTMKEISKSHIWDWWRSSHGPFSRYAILILSVGAAMILTWRCLVGSLWAGLSGSWRYVIGSAILHGAAIVALLVIWSCTRQFTQRQYLFWFGAMGWILALAVILKLWAAVFFWGKVGRRHLSSRTVAKFLLAWAGGTLCLVALACLICPYVYWLQHLFVLGALLGFPLARLGIAPLSLARNRHR